MKRQFILLPITLTTLTPTISMVGCGDPDKPTPPEPEPEIDYTVTQKEMERAIKLDGDQYVQYHEEYVWESISARITITDAKLSPTVYYKKTVTDNSYHEQYVVKNDDNTYTKYYRESAEQENWTKEDNVSSDYFITVEQYGLTMYVSYHQPIDIGATYSFNDEEKCYSASFGQGAVALNWSYYFENKKLIKSFLLNASSVASHTTTTTTFTYDQITPEPPI